MRLTGNILCTILALVWMLGAYLQTTIPPYWSGVGPSRAANITNACFCVLCTIGLICLIWSV